MANIASKEWTKDLLKKALASFSPSEKSDFKYGVGELIDDVENIESITFSDDGNLTIGENQYGYIKASKEINEILINYAPTTVSFIGTVGEFYYYRNLQSNIGSVLFKEVG